MSQSLAPTNEIQHGGNPNGSLESLKRAVQKHWWHYRGCIWGQFIWHRVGRFFSQTALLRWCELMCFHWSDQIKHLQIFSHILHINTHWHCCVISSGINRSLCNREQQMSVTHTFLCAGGERDSITLHTDAGFLIVSCLHSLLLESLLGLTLEAVFCLKQFSALSSFCLFQPAYWTTWLDVHSNFFRVDAACAAIIVHILFSWPSNHVFVDVSEPHH